MRLRRAVPMLATVITLTAGATAPAALALDNTAPSAGQPAALAHPSNSSDWLVVLGTAGCVTLLGSGLAANRRGARRATARGTTIPTTGRS